MSGQPNRYAADAAKFRQDYMNALDLRSSLDDQVLQAVKVYKQTGQVPAISSMPDNRTAEEKLKDIEGMKARIIAEIKPVGSSQFAQEVIQRVMRSPLNSDGSFFSFFTQRIAGIVKNLKESYSIGIKGDANDVERLVSTVEDLYSKDKAMSTTTKSYFDRPSNTTAGGLSAEDLNSLRNQYMSIVAKLVAKYNVMLPYVASIQNKYNLLVDLLNNDFLRRIKDEVIQQGLAAVPFGMMAPPYMAELFDAYTKYNNLLAELPSASKLSVLQIQLDKATANANGNLRDQILQKIDEQIPSVVQIQQTIDAIDQYRLNVLLPPGAGARVANAPRNVPPGGPPPAVVLAPGAPPPIPVGLAGFNYAIPLPNGFNDPHTVISEAQWIAWARNARDAGVGDPNAELAWELINRIAPHDMGNAQTRHNKDRAFRQLRNANPGFMPIMMGGAGPAGEGFNFEKRRRGRPKGCGIKIPFSEKVDSSQGVQASPRYISFGKHVINKKKLGDGILSIRTKSGANIATSPVKHISQNMKNVVDKIIGGAIPSYEELSRLTEEEKSYLHKVSKQADILDKFSIPAPSKDQEEKEIHEYEVMRGEIMSGNDNKELIKKFKLLIIKLSRRGALPKKEVTDILSELVELGY